MKVLLRIPFKFLYSGNAIIKSYLTHFEFYNPVTLFTRSFITCIVFTSMSNTSSSIGRIWPFVLRLFWRVFSKLERSHGTAHCDKWSRKRSFQDSWSNNNWKWTTGMVTFCILFRTFSIQFWTYFWPRVKLSNSFLIKYLNGAKRGLCKTLEATITENGQQTWLLFVSFLGHFRGKETLERLVSVGFFW